MKILLMITIVLFTFINQAYCATLIDTGEPPYSEFPIGPNLGRQQIDDDIEFAWYAGKIILDNQCNITSIKTFFNHNRPKYYPSPDPGPLVDITLVIYDDFQKDLGEGWIEEIPDINSILYTETFGLPSNWQYGWFGIENCNLTLSSGDYWVAFEVHSPTLIETILPFAPNRLHKYAFTNETIYYDYEQGYLDSPDIFALRIEGDVVPEPMTMLLFVFGTFFLKYLKRGA